MFIPPRPPVIARQRTQLEAFLVLRRNALELWGEQAYEKPVIPGKFLGRAQLLVNDPEAIRHVLVANNDNYTRNIGTKRVLGPVIGEGLFLAEGEAWRHQRRTISPAMAPRTMPILARHVVVATEAAEAALRLRVHRPIELLRDLQHLALTIAGQSMFSLEMAGFGAALRRLILRYAVDHAQPGILDLLLPERIASPADLGRRAFRRDWLELMDSVIAARRAQPAPADAPRDLFDLLDAARDPETGAGFSSDVLRDEVATMMLAGHETTAVTLFWSCALAAMAPEHQESMAEEAMAADLSVDHAAASLARLPRIRAHVDEALRLYPPAFLIVRQASGPDTVAGHAIEPGTVVSMSPWVLHRHRRFWDNPDAFDPTRFLPGAPVPERYTYMPFGAGPRICVGAQFALTEATLVMARLLRAFRMRLAAGATMQPRGFVTTQPDRRVLFRLENRNGVSE